MKEKKEDTVLPSDADLESMYRCTQCGAKLTKRSSNNGQKDGKYYWGCSKYPSCQFKLPIL